LRELVVRTITQDKAIEQQLNGLPSCPFCLRTRWHLRLSNDMMKDHLSALMQVDREPMDSCTVKTQAFKFTWAQGQKVMTEQYSAKPANQLNVSAR
jgi:hypothetical protein